MCCDTQSEDFIEQEHNLEEPVRMLEWRCGEHELVSEQNPDPRDYRQSL